MRSVISILCAFWGLSAIAQDARPSHCIALVENTPGIEFLHQASWTDPIADETVRITYISHASFMIQTAGGLSAVTDYTGDLGASGIIPDVATMNHAHDSHWTARPDPGINHVLKGWGNGREPNPHNLDLDEMLVRNVPTDIRGRFGDVAKFGNSIFVFEVAGLCIGHLGHLHHEPDTAQYAALGRLDVVMAPVDGGLTLDLPTMMTVLERLKSSVVIPMHWWSFGSLDTFLTGMSDSYRVQRETGSSLEVSLRSLPSEPTIIVLQPDFTVRRE